MKATFIIAVLALSVSVSGCSTTRPDGSKTVFGQAKDGFRAAVGDAKRDFERLRAQAHAKAAQAAAKATAPAAKPVQKPKKAAKPAKKK